MSDTVKLKIEFKKTQPKLGAPFTNCLVGDGVIVGYVHTPMQARSYTGPRYRADVTLPGIKIREGLLCETEDQARALLELVVLKWFQRCGVVAEKVWPDECHPSHKTRISDASSFDEICIYCGATDQSGGGWGALRKPCTAAPSAPAAEDPGEAV